jgi:hypothetical protein
MLPFYKEEENKDIEVEKQQEKERGSEIKRADAIDTRISQKLLLC